MNTSDVDCLRRMLRLKDEERLPADVEAEYSIRQQMWASSGESGPLGPANLIALLRSLHLGPRAKDEPPPEVDWRSLPQNANVPIEALFNGEWMPGVFVGLLGGHVLVRLEGEQYVKECHKSVVRLRRETPPQAYIRPEEPEPEVGEAACDWSEVRKGAAVWVEDGDETKDAKFQKVDGDVISAIVEGEKKARMFPFDKVQLAPEA